MASLAEFYCSLIIRASHRLSEVYEGHRTRHDPWFEDFKESLKSMTFEPESSSSTPCLMAKSAKVTECYLSESSDDESGDEFGPSSS